MREFKFDDPILRHVDFTEAPPEFFTMAPEEQSWRGRYALLGHCTGYPWARSWALACSADPTESSEMHQVVRVLSDADFESMVEHRHPATQA